MSHLLGGGLYSLAVILASGYILHDAALIRHKLYLPPPIPYFRILVFGLIVWWIVLLVGGLALRLPDDLIFNSWGRAILDPDFAHMPHPLVVFIAACVFRLIADVLDRLIRLSSKLDIRLRIKQSEVSDIHRLMCEANAFEIPVLLTLRNRKAYIGKVFYLSPSASKQEPWIRLAPWQSGYRDEQTGSLQITTDYKSALNNAPQGADWEHSVSMWIPSRDIVTFQLFNPDLYRAFQPLEFGDSTTDSVTTRT